MKMFTGIPATLAIFAFAGLTPIAAFATGCGDYPLTPAELQHIDEMELAIAIPEGDVPIIQRCDTNSDGAVDINDIRAISRHRNQPSAHPDDPMDWDKNSVINLLDARGCQQACSFRRCAVSTTPPSEPPPSQAAQCFQRTDLDGDGSEDIAAIFEHTETQPRGGDWTLEVVIMYEDDNGNLQNVTYPYSGKRSTENGGQLRQHLSLQPPGVVNLAPGNLTIDEPAVVSYRDGEPAVIYYFQNGKMNRAFYGIDD